mgnify:CR=1 FL=1|jgi:hypothetical protein
MIMVHHCTTRLHEALRSTVRLCVIALVLGPKTLHYAYTYLLRNHETNIAARTFTLGVRLGPCNVVVFAISSILFHSIILVKAPIRSFCFQALVLLVSLFRFLFSLRLALVLVALGWILHGTHGVVVYG